MAATSDQPDTCESHSATSYELAGIVTRGAFKVTVQYGGTKDDRESEHDELNRDDLRSVKSLQGAVDVLDLHNGSEDQDSNQ